MDHQSSFWKRITEDTLALHKIFSTSLSRTRPPSTVARLSRCRVLVAISDLFAPSSEMRIGRMLRASSPVVPTLPNSLSPFASGGEFGAEEVFRSLCSNELPSLLGTFPSDTLFCGGGMLDRLLPRGGALPTGSGPLWLLARVDHNSPQKTYISTNLHSPKPKTQGFLKIWTRLFLIRLPIFSLPNLDGKAG